ncbi:MAG: hypothetical protein ACOYK8_02545 [Alphaproteobacteria bacterium]
MKRRQFVEYLGISLCAQASKVFSDSATDNLCSLFNSIAKTSLPISAEVEAIVEKTEEAAKLVADSPETMNNFSKLVFLSRHFVRGWQASL